MGTFPTHLAKNYVVLETIIKGKTQIPLSALSHSRYSGPPLKVVHFDWLDQAD